jgi:hypothetical protein
MAVYTVVLDFAEGTYVHQVRSNSVSSAAKKWVDGLAEEQVRGLGKQGKKRLSEQIHKDAPIALNGLSNAWCQTALVRGKLALVNLIKTA